MIVDPTKNAREFLARALPWPIDGGEKTFVNVHYKVGDHGFPGRACRTIDEAQRTIDWANKNKQDIYVCMSAQSQAEEAYDKLRRVYYKAIRRSEHAAGFRSLFVDVDVKENAYPNTETAAQEFGRIRRELGLPAPSLIIMSGSGGFHAHWLTTETMPVPQWRTLSHALVAGLHAKGFKGDTGVSVDAARLLRVPGTFNYKNGTVKPVTQLASNGAYFVESLQQALAGFIGPIIYNQTTPQAVATPKMAIDLGPVSSLFTNQSKATETDFAQGIEYELPTIEAVAEVCPFIKHVVQSKGEGQTGQLWAETLAVASFCQDTRAVAHRISSGHALYTHESTEERLDRYLKDKASKNMGWPRCTTIARMGTPQCKECPHLKFEKSPLNFLLRSAEEPVATPIGTEAPPPLPPGYVIDRHGFVAEITTDEQGVQSTVRVCGYKIDKPWLQEFPPAINFTAITHEGYARHIRLRLSVLNDISGLSRALGDQHISVFKNELYRVSKFMTSWVEILRANKANIVQSAPFGWYVVNGRVVGFVFAGHVWSKGQPTPAAVADPVLAAQYTPCGELAPWLEAARMITDQRRSELDTILAIAFAGPLVRFTGSTGLLLSTYSTHSGIGKSTTIKVSQAVIGHPQKAVQSLSDTQNAVINKLGTLKNLTMFWDELKSEEDTKRFMLLAMQLSQGKEKSRMQADLTQRDPGTWQTVLCSTSNDSMLAYILSANKSTPAGLYRIFEYVIPPGVHGQISPADAQHKVSMLNDNYGQAGLIYAQFLGANHERVALEVMEMQRQLEKQLDVKADERFWLALITVALMGAKYANELQLTRIDETALRAFLIKKLEEMRGERGTTTVDISRNVNVLAYLAQYLNDKRRRNTIITTTILRDPGRPPLPLSGVPILEQKGVILGDTDTTRLDILHVQLGKVDRWCRILKQPFELWLAQQGITPMLVIKQLETRFGVIERRAKLAAGTPFATPDMNLLEFNYSDSVFENFIDL